eukprot:gene9804-11612_t
MSERVASFWKWMEAQDVVDMDKVCVQPEVLSTGIGFVAKRDISRGESTLSVPKTLFMNVESALESPIGEYCTELKPWLILALHLLHEKSSSDSKWSPYIEILPETLDLPLFWSDEELSELQGTQVLESSLNYRSYVQMEYEELATQLFEPNPEVFPPEVFTPGALLWAFGILRSRTFEPFTADQIALVPGLDLFDHSSQSQSCWSSKGGFGPFQKEGAAVVAEESVSAGTEVRMNYNPEIVAPQLMLDYGFYPSGDRKGGYQLTLGIPPEDKYFDDKADMAELAGLGETWPFMLRAGEAVPDEMRIYLRLIQLSGTDSFLLE